MGRWLKFKERGKMQMKGNKKTIKTPILKRLLLYLKPYGKVLLLAVIFSVLGNFLALIGPFLAGRAVDALALGKGQVDFERVFGYCLLMLIFYGVSSLLAYVLSRLMIKVSRQVSYEMRKDVFKKLGSLPLSYFDHHPTGDLLSRITYDIDTINLSLSNDVVQILSSIITVSGAFVMMMGISPILLGVFFVTLPLSAWSTKWLTKKTRPLFKRRSEKLGQLNAFSEEMISGQKTIQAYHQEENILRRFEQKNKKAAEAGYDADYYGSAIGPVVNFSNNFSLSLVSLFGAIFYIQGGLGLGALSSFVLYSRKFSGPINEIANIYGDLQSALAAAERIFQLLDEQPEPQDEIGAQVLHHPKGAVSFRQVSFAYQPGKEILKDFNLHVEQGQTVAIVGPTGAGKTTLVNLLMRFYDPQQGQILLDGKDIRRFTRKSLRLAFGMVLQEAWFFKGSIFENVAYGKEGASLEEVIEACQKANIHGYIQALPKGYETLLDVDTINISQGQKQLLAIARAMLMDAPLLILDEATSSVDIRTEVKIQEAMAHLMAGKTCFVIAHRLSTIQHADVILVVRGGQVVEAGNHFTLMEKKGAYYELYQAQFGI